MSNKILCQECTQLDKKSEVRQFCSTETLMGYTPYYDKNGDMHNHNPNKISIMYKCSEGHQWIDISYHKCWCGWDGNPKGNKIQKPLTVITDHVDILEMCSAGMMGSQIEWPQLRPACREAVEEIKKLRNRVRRLKKLIHLHNHNNIVIIHQNRGDIEPNPM